MTGCLLGTPQVLFCFSKVTHPPGHTHFSSSASSQPSFPHPPTPEARIITLRGL